MSDKRKDLVDDQKRKARRRLVGAAILALAAAVIVPLFLESEPKPLGQDVQILIPADEGGKFVNQLSAAAPGARVAAPVALPEAVPKAESPGPGAAVDAEKSAGPQQGTQGPQSQASAPASGKTAQTPSAGLPQVESRSDAAVAKPAATPAPRVSPPAPKNSGQQAAASAATVSAKPIDSGFVVQLGAYADAKVAAELQAKVKAAGFVAYTERFETSKEKLHRVRVGPFSSRDAADTVRAQLKAKGHSGIVAPL